MAGVRAAAIASDLPLLPDGERRAFTPEVRNPSSAPQPAIAVTWVHGEYFASFGIPILRGRDFTREEQAVDRRAVIVSRNVAAAVKLPKLRSRAHRRQAWTSEEARVFLESARTDHDVTLLDALLAAAVDGHGSPELRRLAGDDRRGDRLVVEAGLQLEQPGQEIVLALRLLEARVLDPQAVVLLAE